MLPKHERLLGLYRSSPKTEPERACRELKRTGCLLTEGMSSVSCCSLTNHCPSYRHQTLQDPHPSRSGLLHELPNCHILACASNKPPGCWHACSRSCSRVLIYVDAGFGCQIGLELAVVCQQWVEWLAGGLGFQVQVALGTRFSHPTATGQFQSNKCKKPRCSQKDVTANDLMSASSI